jgi:hypothetical protein
MRSPWPAERLSNSHGELSKYWMMRSRSSERLWFYRRWININLCIIPAESTSKSELSSIGWVVYL